MSISFKNIEQAAASALQEFHTGVAFVEKELPKVEKAAPLVEAGLEALAPKDAVLIRASFACLGKVIAVMSTGDDEAKKAMGLDDEFTADLKTVMAQFSSQLATAQIKL